MNEKKASPVKKASGLFSAWDLHNFPWWMVGIVLIIFWMVFTIFTRESYREAFDFILVGIWITIFTTLVAYAAALILGLLAGLGRLSTKTFVRNIAILYIELVRGIPMLVLIFYLALVAIPGIVDRTNSFGVWLTGIGMGWLGHVFTAYQNQDVSMNVRAIIALAITYGAFLAEIFRAGIQSVGASQMEAARSLGMSYFQALRYIILPQAIRNILPALGNDFVAMLKDSSLVSVLAVRDITQVARLYAGRTFRFEESYTTLAVVYLTLTISLSLLVQYLERRIRKQ